MTDRRTDSLIANAVLHYVARPTKYSEKSVQIRAEILAHNDIEYTLIYPKLVDKTEGSCSWGKERILVRSTVRSSVLQYKASGNEQ